MFASIYVDHDNFTGLRTVARAVIEFDGDMRDRESIEQTILPAVLYVLQDGNDVQSVWSERLAPLVEDYGRETRSLRVGDFIGIALSERFDDLAEMREFRIENFGLNHVSPYEKRALLQG